MTGGETRNLGPRLVVTETRRERDGTRERTGRDRDRLRSEHVKRGPVGWR